MSCPLGGQDINLISWWLTSPFSCMMGWGSLLQPGPAGTSPAPMVLPTRWQSCISPQDSAALLSGVMLRDHRLFEVCFSQLNQEEMVCPHLGFGKGNVKLVAWLVFFCSVRKACKQHIYTAVCGPIVHPMHSGSTVLSDQRSWSLCNGSCWKKISLKPQIW